MRAEDIAARLRNIRIERHGQAAAIALEHASVGIAGLGGLGSHIAISLARMGIGQLILVDFDHVDISNLQRQHYNLTHLGQAKCDALAEQIHLIAPECQCILHKTKVTADNALSLFQSCDVLCEAFDDAAAKAMLVETILSESRKTMLVAASGMAGHGSANLIRTEQRGRRLYLCGDGVSDIHEAHLYAARVALCANHQSMMVLRLLLGEPMP